MLGNKEKAWDGGSTVSPWATWRGGGDGSNCSDVAVSSEGDSRDGNRPVAVQRRKTGGREGPPAWRGSQNAGVPPTAVGRLPNHHRRPQPQQQQQQQQQQPYCSHPPPPPPEPYYPPYDPGYYPSPEYPPFAPPPAPEYSPYYDVPGGAIHPVEAVTPPQEPLKAPKPQTPQEQQPSQQDCKRHVSPWATWRTAPDSSIPGSEGGLGDHLEIGTVP